MKEHLLEFKATNGYLSRCKITIYRAIQLVIVSETGEGMSVTNAAEIIATDLVNHYGIDPARMLYIEHYSADQRPKPYGESYDLATITWDRYGARNPDWRHLLSAEFDEILNTVKS